MSTEATRIRKFILSAISQRKRFIASNKSRINSSSLMKNMIFLKAYAEEIKERNRIARFYINNFYKILEITPPTWKKQAHEIYDECQTIIQ